MKNKIKTGDKVRINLSTVLENGMTESSDNAEGMLSYITAHPDEVYTIKATDALAAAPIVLDHPVLGDTSFFEEELMLVVEEKTEKSRKEILREKILALMNSDDSRDNYEKVAEAVFNSINSDDESYSHIGYNLLMAFLKNDADGMLTAICGWCMESILAKAKLIPDKQGVFVGNEEDE